jgi:hypothetical protein
VPTVVTVAIEWAGWWHPSSIVRAGTGVLLGLAGALIAVAAVAAPEAGRGDAAVH